MSILAAAAVNVTADPLSDFAGRLGWSLMLTAAGIGAGFGAIRAATRAPWSRWLIVAGAVALVALIAIVQVIAWQVLEFVAEPSRTSDVWPWFAFLGVVMVFSGLATACGFVIGRTFHLEQGNTTWALAMIGAVLVFAWMLLAYAIVPDAWIYFADGKLLWTRDQLFYGNAQKTAIPFNISYQAVRDLVVIGIYSVLGVVNVVLIMQWQKRYVVKAAPAEGEVPAKRSRFGRPIFRGAR